MAERKTGSRKAKWALAAVAVVAVLLLIAGLAFQTSRVRQTAVDRVFRYIEERYGISIDAETVEFNLPGLRFDLGNVRIEAVTSQSALPDPEPFFQADRVFIDLDTSSLFGNTIVVDDAQVENGRVAIVIDRAGRRNLPDLGSGDPGRGTGLAVRVRRFEADGTQFDVTDDGRQLAVVIPRWRIGVESTDGDHTIRAEFPEGATVRRADLEVDVRTADLDLTLGPESIDIQSLRAESAVVELDASGIISGFSPLSPDLSVNAAVDLGELARILDLDIPMEGRVTIENQISGEFEDLGLTGEAQGEDLAIGDFVGLAMRSRFAWNREDGDLGLEALALDGPDGSLRVSGHLGLDEAATTELGIEAESLDLEQLGTLAGLPIGVASRASGTVDISWPGFDWTLLEAEGDLRMEPARSAVAYNSIPMAGRLSFAGGLGGMDVTIDSAGFSNLSAEGRVSWGENRRIEGRIDARSPNAATLVADVDRFLNDGPPPEGASGSARYPMGPVNVSAEIAGTFESPEVRFDLAAPRTTFSGLPESIPPVAVETQGVFGNRRLSLDPVVIEWNGESVTAQASMDFGGEEALLSMVASGSAFRLENVLAGVGTEDAPMTGPDAVSGSIDILASASGPIDRLMGELVLGGSDIAVHGKRFDSFDARLSLTPERLELVQLTASEAGENASGTISASGFHVLETGEIDLRLDGGNVDLSGLTVPGAEGLEGTATLSVVARGTTAEPRVTVDATVDGASYNGLILERVDLDGELDGERIALASSVPAFNLVGNLGLTLAPGYPATLEATTTGLDLGRLAPLVAPERVAGRVAVSIRAEGEIENWMDATATVQIDSADVQIDGQQLGTQGSAVLRYEGRRIAVEPFTLVAGNQQLEVSGNLPAETGGTEGLIRILGTLDLEPLAALAPLEEPLDVRGRLGVDLELSGSAESVAVDGLLELRGGDFRLPGSGSRVAPIDADLHVEDSVLVIDGVLAFWADSFILVEGAVPLNVVSDIFRAPAGPSTAALIVTAEDLQLESLPGGGALEGTADITIELEADSMTLEAIRGTARLDRLDLESTPIGITPGDPIVVTLENGVGRLEPFVVGAGGTELTGDGEFALTGDRRIRIDVEGRGDTSALTAAFPSVGSSGTFVVDLAVEGTIDAPSASGSIRLENVAFDVPEPPIEGRNVNATVLVTPGMMTLQNLSGIVNDGTIGASGTLSYRGMEVAGAGIDVSGRGIYFEAAEGFETLSNTYIQVRSGGDVIEISGGVQVLEGSYTNDLSLEELVRDALGGGPGTLFVEEPNPLLSRLRYNVNVESLSPILVSNNAAELEADVNVRLTGTYNDPGLVGRIFIAEGGTIQLQETEFVMQAGFIDFANPTRIEPDLALSAATTKAGYEITMDVTGGGAQDLDTVFVSDPPLPEPEIIALLVTGRTLEGVRGAELNIAREQALSYVTGALGGSISRGAREALGVSRVSIEPNLIANESDPGARLTVGQDITRNLGLIYSMNLADSNDQIWIVEYDVRRRFLARSIKQEDNSYRFELQHRMTFGEIDLPGRSESLANRRIGTVQIDPQAIRSIDLTGEFGLAPGDSYDPFSVRDARRDLTGFLADRSFLEADIRIERMMEGDRMNLQVLVDPGPEVRFVYEGADVPGRIRDEVRRVWSGSTFDSIRAALALDALRSGFIRDRYFEVEAESRIEETDQSRTVYFTLRPGVRYETVRFEFPGARGISEDSLADLIDDQDRWSDVVLDPEGTVELVEQHYRSRAYLDAAIGEIEASFDPDRRVAVFSIPVVEGPEYRLGPDVVFSGNVRVPEEELTIGLPEAGIVFEPELVETSTDVIYQHYWQRGFSDATVDTSIVRRRDTGIVDLVFEIDENRRDRIDEIEITGNNRTSENLIRNQIALDAGQYLDIRTLGTARRNLYNTGAYTLVDVEPVDVDDAARGEATPGDGDAGVRLRISVREVPPYSFRYGAFYDTERGPGGTIDLRNQNSLGSARTIGLRLRYDGRLREARTFFSQPALPRLPFQTNTGLFLREERKADRVTRDIGADLQQEVRLGSEFIVTYGYSFLHSRSFHRDDETNTIDDAPFDVSNVAPLSLTLTRDTRDDLLDASRGTFMTHSIEFAPRMLGSDDGLVRYFGQYFRYRALSEPVQIPYSGGRQKARFVYAVGARLGLAAGLDGSEVPPGERFFAGGGTTIRGFEQDAVGPMGFRDGELVPIGGGGVLVVNNELRFPLVNIFDGVAFLDIGNVYESVRDFDPFHLRSSAGVGLRVRTPFFLLRADYGFNLTRKPGEPSGTFFFSIGQAF